MHKIVSISTTTGSIPCDYFIPIECLNERVFFAKKTTSITMDKDSVQYKSLSKFFMRRFELSLS